SYVSDQASAATGLAASVRTRSPYNLCFAVSANKAHLLGPSRAVRAFVTTNVSYFACYNRPSAFFADSLSAPAPFVSSPMRGAVANHSISTNKRGKETRCNDVSRFFRRVCLFARRQLGNRYDFVLWDPPVCR